MTHLSPTTVYKIKAAHSNKYLQLVQPRIGTSTLKQATSDSASGTEFFIVPVDDAHFAFLPKGFATVLDVAQDGHIFDPLLYLVLGRNVIGWAWHGKANQRFLLTQTDDGAFYISPRDKPNEVFDVRGESKEDYAEIIIWSKHDSKNQQFYFEAQTTVKVPVNPSNHKARDPLADDAQRPKLSSLDRPAEVFDQRFIGQTLIPYLFVKDKNRNPETQANKCPWYVLRREQMWQLEDSEAEGAAPSRKITRVRKTGLTETVKVAVDQTLKLDVVPKIGYKGVDIVTGTFSSELKMSFSAERVFTEEAQETLEMTTPDNVAFAWATWSFVDRYTLTPVFLDPREVANPIETWSIKISKTGAQDTFQAPLRPPG